MRFIALLVWFITVLWGLYMLTVWLIESDATRQGSADSRLPLPVILTHMVLALTGLGIWVVYLLLDRPVLAWVAVGDLGAIVAVGTAMFARWIPVYRSTGGAAVRAPTRAAPVASVFTPAAGVAAAGNETAVVTDMPAEGNFPLVVVVAHGLFATATVTFVVLTALGVGGS
jgi:hypothetical protein